MDRNTILGFLLMFGLLMGYNWYTAPSEEDLAEMERLEAEDEEDRENKIDSESLQAEETEANFLEEEKNAHRLSLTNMGLDSIGALVIPGDIRKQYGPVALAVFGEDQEHVLTSSVVGINVNSAGGLPYSAT